MVVLLEYGVCSIRLFVYKFLLFHLFQSVFDEESCCIPHSLVCIIKLNKNTLGVKKVRGQSEAALQIGMYDQKL